MIINSLLDNDMYKFTMQQAVLHNYSSAWVKYKFKCRNHEKTLKKIENKKEFLYTLNSNIKSLQDLKLQESELVWLQTLRFFKPDYIDFLERFEFNPFYVQCEIKNGELGITVEGPWVQTILFEVPILSTVSELYTKSFNEIHDPLSINDKINYLEGSNFLFGDMGTRRRSSYQEQKEILTAVVKSRYPHFTGTSNLHFARILGLTPLGTMAHEWVQAHQQLTNLKDSQKTALDVWAHEYRGDLGIALSDTLGFDKFLDDFDLYLAKLFTGCRHDSGDPFMWTDKLIEHYKKLGIDPKTKNAIYSDGLDFETADRLHYIYPDKINTSFGIGTWLTNNTVLTPPQIVIKMVECNGYPVAKISDDIEKGMCENENYLNYLKEMCMKGE